MGPRAALGDCRGFFFLLVPTLDSPMETRIVTSKEIAPCLDLVGVVSTRGPSINPAFTNVTGPW